MTTWQQIQKADLDGDLDRALLPDLLESRRALGGFVNVMELGVRNIIARLTQRVNDLITLREQEGRDNAAAQAGAARHQEKLALDREAITLSREALGISKEANKISVDSNVISNTANTIAKKANSLSRGAVFVACLAFLCSLGQCVSTWWPKPMQSSSSSIPGAAPPTQATPILPAPFVQTSNSTSPASTIHIPTNTPATNRP
jgi:hypothetical protein